MPELKQMSKSAPGMHRMDLAINVAGDKLTVVAGTVMYKGTEYMLAEDETYVATQRPHATEVMAYLVIDHRGDKPELRVAIDETVLDDVDVPFKFDRDGDVELFAYLFQMIVPAGETDLSGLDYLRWTIEEEA